MTAYGKENDDTLAHRLLGRAMQILHDNTMLSADHIRAAFPESDLHNQVERIRITLQPLTLEETSKLWSSFQTQYRISATYEVSVVLIDSQRPSVTPLPVLMVGRNNAGVIVQSSVLLPFPTLETVVYRDGQASIFLGTPADGTPDLTLQGQNLVGDVVRVFFQHPRLSAPLAPAQILARTPLSLPLVLPQPGNAADPNAATNQWLAGLYRVKAVISSAAALPERVTNEMAIALNDSTSALPTQLASQFNLSAVAISAIAQRSAASSETLWSNCLIHTRPQLDTLAQRIDTKATWTDLILPAEATNLLKQIADQVRQRHQVYEEWGFHRKLNRGMGINALFAGESGTGKTMAAEVIANDLKLNLYRIDLSAVVSKYIGETEKNLRRLFDAAEDGGAILLFDEADALFGKRSEVKDSHDRYANIEINYLLQRMEAYRGLAILATNMKNALDTAFLRRLRFIVNFPFPSLRERIRLWQQAFPPETPTTGLDCDRLATLNLTGGNIHTVAINAAFLAAQAGTPVTMPLVLAAARTEYRKLDRPINELDFQ